MQLTAQKRTEFGKKNKKLRRQRLLPAVVFGKDLDSQPITIKYTDFVRVFTKAGETNLIDLKIGDSTEKVLVKSTQTHPVTEDYLHVDFHQVNLKEKVSASIPVEVVGEEEIELVKNGEALVQVLLNEVDVEALPMDLPDRFVVDVSGFSNIDDSITIGDLDYNKEKVEIEGFEDDELVVKLSHAVQEEEEEEELTEEELLEQLEVTEEKDTDEDASDGGTAESEDSTE